ncbi:hypothetical protein [uncultured Actinomyces sp.]|uniref:hypothetical protein n=1 Tax=uncultured Actinomyces sp. TaxID=249061 RepID=UPI0026067E3D|nr:hypothetical protein [uncultured Actinomyces sp.]
MVAKTDLGSLASIASGGFGEVFRTGFRLPGYRGALAYKELKSSLSQDKYSRAVEAMRQAVQLRDSMSDGDRSDLDEVTVWPLALVEEGGVVRGCLMPLIRPEFFAELHPPATGKKDSKTRDLAWLPARSPALQRAGFSQDQIDEFSDLLVRMRIMVWLVYSVALMHKYGVVYGDMSLKNAVFCLGEYPRSVLMDCDGVARLDDASRRQANSPSFLAPECEEPGRNPFARGRAHFQDTRTDVYKLGLCVVRCLSRGRGAMQRKSADHLTGLLSPECLDVIKASLSQDPDQRPTAKQLYQALNDFIVPVIREFRVLDSVVPRGGGTMLVWNVSNATKAFIHGPNGSVVPVDPLQGQHPVQVHDPTVFTLEICRGSQTVQQDSDLVRVFDVPKFDIESSKHYRSLSASLNTLRLPPVDISPILESFPRRPAVGIGGESAPEIMLPSIEDFVRRLDRASTGSYEAIVSQVMRSCRFPDLERQAGSISQMIADLPAASEEARQTIEGAQEGLRRSLEQGISGSLDQAVDDISRHVTAKYSAAKP